MHIGKVFLPSENYTQLPGKEKLWPGSYVSLVENFLQWSRMHTPCCELKYTRRRAPTSQYIVALKNDMLLLSHYITDYSCPSSRRNCTWINLKALDFSGEVCPHPSSSRRDSSTVIVVSFKPVIFLEYTAIEKLGHRKSSQIMSVCKVKLNRNTAIFHFGVCICTPVPPENALTIKHHYTQEYQEYYVHIVYNLCAWVEPNGGFLIKIRSRKLGFSHWLFPKLQNVIYWISIIRAIVGVLIRQFVSLGTNEQRKTAV